MTKTSETVTEPEDATLFVDFSVIDTALEGVSIPTSVEAVLEALTPIAVEAAAMVHGGGTGHVTDSARRTLILCGILRGMIGR